MLGRSTKATLRLTELSSYRSDILDLSKVEAANIDLEAIALSQADSVHGGGSIASRVALDKGLAHRRRTGACDAPARRRGRKRFSWSLAPKKALMEKTLKLEPRYVTE